MAGDDFRLNADVVQIRCPAPGPAPDSQQVISLPNSQRASYSRKPLAVTSGRFS